MRISIPSNVNMYKVANRITELYKHPLTQFIYDTDPLLNLERAMRMLDSKIEFGIVRGFGNPTVFIDIRQNGWNRYAVQVDAKDESAATKVANLLELVLGELNGTPIDIR